MHVLSCNTSVQFIGCDRKTAVSLGPSTSVTTLGSFSSSATIKDCSYAHDCNIIFSLELVFALSQLCSAGLRRNFSVFSR